MMNEDELGGAVETAGAEMLGPVTEVMEAETGVDLPCEQALATEADDADEAAPSEPAEPEEGDAIDWQARAQQAESKLSEVASKLGEVERAAHELYAAMEQQRLERICDVLLLRAGVTDLQAARSALSDRVEAERSEGDERELTLDGQTSAIEAAVRSLVAERPGLFGGGGSLGGVLRSTASGARSDAERAASEARSTGDRRQLLKYLRLRRSQ